MRPFLTAYRLLVYHLSFLLFGLFGLLLNLVCFACGWLPATPATERFFQRVIQRHFMLWFWWLELVGIVVLRYEGAPGAPAGHGVVVVGNHPGLMDAMYLVARWPRAFCVFKPAIRRNPVLGAAARRAGYVASDGGHDTLRAAADKVARGETLVVFPEGTRSRAGVLQPFKPGFALVARVAGAPIQLVRITMASPLLAKGVPWWRIPPLPVRINVAYGPCLPPPSPTQKTTEVVAAIEGWFRHGDAMAPRPAPADSALASLPQPATERWQTAT